MRVLRIRAQDLRAQRVDRVGQDVGHGGQHLGRTAHRAGQVDDEGLADRAGLAAREEGTRGDVEAAQPGEFEQAGVAALEDGGGRLGRDVAWCEARAPGGEDEVDRVLLPDRFQCLRPGQQRRLDRVYLVGHAARRDDLRGELFFGQCAHGRAGGVGGLAARAAVTHGEHRDADRRG